MCLECGCGSTGGSGIDEHGHDHTHDSNHGDNAHHHHHEHRPHRTVLQVEQDLLEHNRLHAEENRSWLDRHDVVAVNIISSPGSGKTTLLERTLEHFQGHIPCAVVAGDQQTDHDARRLAGKGAAVVQIETHNACHLDAVRLGQVLPEVASNGVRLLFIENVGNLVCPAAFDLGENFKIALLSSTEGEDKPVKYPTLFSRSAVTVLTKMDLVPHLDWDVQTCRRYLRQVHPGMFIFELSARTGDGMSAWFDYLESLVR